ncbi:hypothetical protein [Tychonema sp. LEGE 07203]|uniref:hypothetical protein n=1 Tax=Tychonema sp. LEGE 07203 TaxID=1828671 RepID=UPI001D1418A5|nr:hypothetical protein [Tychonema sp. LEGE 07203]
MTKPTVNYRRIDQLKAIAYDRGFTNEDAKQFGKLSKTATWEALLELYLVDGESPDTVNVDTVDTILGTTLDKSPDTGDTVANSRKQSDCLCTLTEPLDKEPESPDTGDTVANSRKQSDCLCTLTEPLDKELETAPDTAGTTVEPLDTVNVDAVDTLDWTNDGSFPVCGFTRQNSTSFLDWVNLSQLIALVLASAGVFVLAMSLWRQINPLNLFPSPVRINIQIGTK